MAKDNLKGIIGFSMVILIGIAIMFTDAIPLSGLRIITIFLILLGWGICIYNVVRLMKEKEYTTFLPLALCEIIILLIITTYSFKIVLLEEVVRDSSIWIIGIIGILTFVHKRLKSPKYLSPRRKFKNPRGKYSV
ncbi:MAG: hypothetical protein RR840_01205 [Clostridium sp.]